MAGDISLDFANTAEWHAGPEPVETLNSYHDAVSWARRAGALNDEDAGRLLALAAKDTEAEARALQRIIVLREAIYRIFSAVSHRRPPDPRDLDTLNRELTQALAHLRLVPPGDGEEGAHEAGLRGAAAVVRQFAWTWVGIGEDLTSLLWPVSRSAATLLSSARLTQVRECAGDPCGWLFLDLSKNASRRWCDMAACGNRAKAKRYRTRRKAEVDSTPGA